MSTDANPQTYGYCRVSSRDQNLDRQLAALARAGVPAAHIFADKRSGKDFDRPAWIRLMGRLRPGDVLMLPSIDRMGRGYGDILEQWRILTREKRAAVVVLDMPLLDTRQDKDLTGALIADIVLQLLSYVAQREREAIRQRQSEGIAAARARGIHLGRPSGPLPGRFSEFADLYRAGRISASAAARACGMSRTTFQRRAEQRQAGGRLLP